MAAAVKSFISWPLTLASTIGHNATRGRFLKTSYVSFADCFLLLDVGPIPLAMLEMAQVVRQAQRLKKVEP